MPGGGDPENRDSSAPPQLSLRQRLLLSLPRLKHPGEKAPLGERLRGAVLKPPPPGEAAPKASNDRLSVEELEAQSKYANDKERLIGLIAAPFAAAIGLIVIDALIGHDPSALLKNGQVNKLHVSVSLYHELELVLIGLAVVMLVLAMLRKRLYLGIVMALYGLAIFNLRYWGFGIPFVMAGAWYLVRAYRLQRDLREATGGKPPRAGSQRRRDADTAPRPQPNKRFTPPPSPSKMKRASRPRPDSQKRAG